MRNGDEFPPIKVAKIGRELFVIDGFHRLAATERNRQPTIAAEVARMTEAQAVALAIDANAKHPLQLTRADKQRCFQLYRSAGWHKDADGRVKSLRVIARDLGDIAWPNTIRRWLQEANIEPSEDEYEEPLVPWSSDVDDAIIPEEEMQVLSTIDEHLTKLITSYQFLEDPLNRANIRQRLEAILRDLSEDEAVSNPHYLDI
jgi:hypothetical protein